MKEGERLADTLAGLFTEIAILEHLTRTRVERTYTGGLQPWHFGILNYFIRNHPGADTVAGIAFAFQDPEETVGERVVEMESRGWLHLDPAGAATPDTCVSVTDAGREKHRTQLEEIAPDFTQLVSEIPLERLEVAHEVLREIRLTMDNLPDR